MTIDLGDINLKILPEAYYKMQAYIQDSDSKEEAGGIMLGYCIDENNFSIIEVTMPNKEDRRSIYGFWRASALHQRFLNMLFKKSKGKCIYLGEWHTHPEDYPTPSSLDRKSLVDQILKSQLNSNKIFGIIIGLKGLHISLVKKTGIQYERQLKYEDLSCPVDTWSIDS